MRNAIASRYAINLPATIIYDYPSPSALATYITTQLAMKVPASTTDSIPSAELGDFTTPASEQHSLATVPVGQSDHTSDVIGISIRYPGAFVGALSSINIGSASVSAIFFAIQHLISKNALRKICGREIRCYDL